MIPKPPSAWDRFHLRFMRVLATTLGAMDAVLNVHWGERLLNRLVIRWESRLAELDQAMSILEQEHSRLQRQTEAFAIHAATIYLGGRSLMQESLTFDPKDPHDEEILDATIALLVKERLAAMETQQMEDGRHIYHLEPDWALIRTRLADAATDIQPDTAEWLYEGIKLIDDVFLTKVDIELT